jgi:chromosome segregation protein
MKIKRLELNGFKSFPEKTIIPFPKGISGVVGPNGCGKSNIVDAIKWVMGEQSPKQLRGKGMEDVIFAGSNGKSSVGMAEVSLVLDNDNGSFPPEMAGFSEVVITRRLFRDGESEYAINNQACRLKDITHLFMGTGVGSRAYAVIEQGRVGAIIDSKPEDRRHWIEEAAGISKYKHRKQETLRKLESTQQNMLRVGDVIAEVKRQMNSLYRQAKKAERFKEARLALKDIELTLTLRDYGEIQEEKGRLEQELDLQQGQLRTSKEEIAAIQNRLQQIQAQLGETDRRLKVLQEQYYQQKGSREKQEGLLQQLHHELEGLERERLETEQELKEIQTWLQDKEIEAQTLKEAWQSYQELVQEEQERVSLQEGTVNRLKSEQSSHQQELEDSKDHLLNTLSEQTRIRNLRLGLIKLREDRNLRLVRQEEERDQLSERRDHLNRLSAEATEKIDREQKTVEDLRADLEQKRAGQGEQVEIRKEIEGELKELERLLLQDQGQIKNLQQIRDNYQSYQNGVRSLLQHDRLAGDEEGKKRVRLLAEGIETEPGYEAAVEAALGESLQAVIVQDQEEALEGIRQLRGSQAGKATFLLLNQSQPAEPGEGASALWPTNGFQPLIAKVVVKSELQSWVEHLLGEFLLVPDLDKGLKLWKDRGGRNALVTPEGDVISRLGVISGGSSGKTESGILFQKNLIRRLERQIRDGENQVRGKRTALEGQTEILRTLEKQLAELESQIRESEKRKAELEKIQFGYQEEAKPLQRRLTLIAIEEEETRSLVASENSEEEIHRTQEEALNEEVAVLRNGLQDEEETGRTLSKRLEEAREVLTRITTEYSVLKEKGDHLSKEAARLQEALTDRHNRRQRLIDRLAAGDRRKEDLEIKMAEAERALVLSKTELEKLEILIQAGNQAWEKDQQEKERVETESREKRSQIEELEAQHHELQLQAAQGALKLEHLKEKTREQFGCELETILERPQPNEADFPALSQKRQELREKIEQIGEVNLTALEEFQAFKERHDFYQSQEEDLVKSIDSLKRAIQKINGTSKDLFLSTFKAIQDKMDLVFPILFGGGTAKLSLVNEEDPLEAGIDIIIHPPGKRLTSMGLLSGGEKALTALALVFSIYLVKPSPFCLLDEIDAFLDEANVERFKKFVHGLVDNSQIILITHNRRIMEMADALYGVTMEQPGISKLVSVRLDNVLN